MNAGVCLQASIKLVRAELAKAGVLEYQVSQTTNGMKLRVVPGASTDGAALCERMETVLREAGVPAPQVDVDVVAHLEPSAKSGKLARFVPLPAG